MTIISRRAALASALAAAGSLAACGGQPAAQGAATTAAASPAASGATKLTFCLDYVPNTNHTGIYVAKAKGWFAEEGIELEIVQPAEDTAEAMIGTGQAQLGVSYQDYIANVLAADAPMPIVAVAAILQHNTSGIMSRAADGITHPAAMAGHRYATWELPVEQATVRDVVEADGGDYSQVELVPYSVDDEVSGLRANMFDCVWVYEGWAVQNAKVQSYDVNYFSFISIDQVFDYYTPVLAVNSEWAAKNPELVRAFLRAAKRGYEHAIAQPDDAASLLLEQVPELDEKLVRASQTYLAGQYQADAASWGEIDPARWKAFYQWLNDKKLVARAIDPSAGFTTEYLNA